MTNPGRETIECLIRGSYRFYNANVIFNPKKYRKVSFEKYKKLYEEFGSSEKILEKLTLKEQ